MKSAFLAAALVCAAAPILAEDRQTLGWGRLLTNDYIGDVQDRWRTSSYAVSMIRGAEWDGALPSDFGALLEYRVRAEIIAPETLRGARSNDRAYANALTFGTHSHWQQGALEARAGLDLVVLGPQTGLGDAQDWFHELIGEPLLGANVIANQVPNQVTGMLSGELAWPVQLSPAAELRPFAEVQIGMESLARVGMDMRFGILSNEALSVRDVTTGQRYRAITNNEFGWEFVAGADVAYVADSVFFPESFGTAFEEVRYRVRLGAHWQGGENTTFFYGATYLSPEYVGQPEGQIVGSAKLNFNF